MVETMGQSSGSMVTMVSVWERIPQLCQHSPLFAGSLWQRWRLLDGAGRAGPHRRLHHGATAAQRGELLSAGEVSLERDWDGRLWTGYDRVVNQLPQLRKNL